jgi:alkyl hydroperoxide reductase subunit AhpC
LLADFHPKGDVARQYGVYLDDRGYAQRAIFVVDEAGILRWSRIFVRDMPNMSRLRGVLADLAQ